MFFPVFLDEILSPPFGLLCDVINDKTIQAKSWESNNCVKHICEPRYQIYFHVFKIFLDFCAYFGFREDQMNIKYLQIVWECIFKIRYIMRIIIKIIMLNPIVMDGLAYLQSY